MKSKSSRISGLIEQVESIDISILTGSQYR